MFSLIHFRQIDEGPSSTTTTTTECISTTVCVVHIFMLVIRILLHLLVSTFSGQLREATQTLPYCKSLGIVSHDTLL